MILMVNLKIFKLETQWFSLEMNDIEIFYKKKYLLKLIVTENLKKKFLKYKRI